MSESLGNFGKYVRLIAGKSFSFHSEQIWSKFLDYICLSSLLLLPRWILTLRQRGRLVRDDNGARLLVVQIAGLNSVFHSLMALSLSLATRRCCPRTVFTILSIRPFTASAPRHQSQDPRVSDLGPTIKDDYANIRAKYRGSHRISCQTIA